MEQVPAYKSAVFFTKRNKYCLCIPVINEGTRILDQLDRLQKHGLSDRIDVILCDGGSTDGSMEEERLRALGVCALLTKAGPGKLSAQLRMGYSWGLAQGYAGIVTIDGNGKDGVEAIPSFIEKLDQGYDLIQGSRFIRGGQAINTPVSRLLAVKLLHAPTISLAAGFHFTDTTNGYRGYSRRYLTDPRVLPFRDIFATYELLAYLSARGPRLGMRTIEIPVTRAYPASGAVPTKISHVRGNLALIRILWQTLTKQYDPRKQET